MLRLFGNLRSLKYIFIYVLNSGWSIDIVTTLDTANFIDEHYSECETAQYKDEVLSLVEQELAKRGEYFIFSELSGWSANVRKERILEDKYFYEMSVIKLIEDFGPFSQNYSTTELYSKEEIPEELRHETEMANQNAVSDRQPQSVR